LVVQLSIVRSARAPAGGNGEHVELLFPSVLLAGEVNRAGFNGTSGAFNPKKTWDNGDMMGI
jgi:hypothetical protein